MTSSSSGGLCAAFQATVDASADRVAVSAPGGDLTFGEAARLARRFVAALNESGIASRDVVHMALPNAGVVLPALVALRETGAVVGLVSARYRDAEFRALTERMAPKAFLTTPQLASVIERAIDVRERTTVAVDGADSELTLVFPAAAPTDVANLGSRHRDLALVKFTSGSTGAPKGVGLSEANLLAEAANVVATLGITPSDRILVPVPVSHSYGFDLGLLPVVVAGASAQFRRSFIPREVLADLARRETSILLGVPSMYRILADTPPADVPDLSHVRYLLSCTAPLLPELVTRCRDVLHVSVCQHYGSSESGAVATHRPGDVARFSGSVGVPMANVDVRIVDGAGATLGPGQEGEIVVRSHAVSAGYVTDELPSSQEVFASVGDGRNEYRTGDIGVINEEGFIFWRGRRDQVINVGGLKVYPSEVVNVLERCPAVASARVVGARDQSGEEIVHAVVTVSQSIREQDILAFCRQHLADYKVPRRIAIVESISTAEAAKMSDLTGEA